MLLAGRGEEQDPQRAAMLLNRAAQHGLAPAQLALVGLYDRGQGVPLNRADAAGWYRKASLLGLAEAQLNLGMMYQAGQGVPQDFTQAADLYRRAAEQRNASAQFNLGAMYAKGDGVPVNFVEAYFWLDLAANTWSGAHQHEAVDVRDKVGARLSTTDLMAAKQRAKDWLDARKK
jgi:uncharacterized protein